MSTAKNVNLLKRNLFFLGLMNKNKLVDDKSVETLDNMNQYIPATLYSHFIKIHVPLLSSLYIVEYTTF